MELACRAYLARAARYLNENNWPPVYDPATAEPMRHTLETVLKACLSFARRAAEKRIA